VPGDPHPGAFEADVEAAAAAGLSLETFVHLTEEQFAPGQLAEFMQLDLPMRTFVLRVLGGLAGPSDYEWFDRRDDAKAVAAWMLELPAFRRHPG
jgi:hypothetical protein